MLSLFSFQNCRKPEPIGKGYVLIPGLCIHSKPTYKSECTEKLDSVKPIQILGHKIKDEDSNSNLYWYRVLSEKNDGYISLDEEVRQGSFAVIFPNYVGTRYVNASALRVRSLPSLTGEIVENLPNGTEVSVIGQTPFKIKIEDKYDNWSEVRTPSGKTGFSYSGFLREATLNNPGTSEDAVSGIFVVNNKDAILWTEPGIKSGQLGSCNSRDLGNYLNVTAAKLVNNVKYYLVEKSVKVYSDYYLDELGCINAWISEEDGQAIEDLYEWSSKEYGNNIDKTLINQLHENQELPLFDLSSLKINELGSLGKKGELLFEVTYNILDSNFNRERQVRSLYAQAGGNYYLLLNNLGDFNTEDFDNDGISEWVVKFQLRSGEVTIYYARKANSLSPFLSVEENELGPCNLKINDSIDIAPSATSENKNKQNCEIKIEPPFFNFRIYDQKYKYKLSKGELVSQRK
ncbi:SH3 domain-containing protein [Leptospira kmetyi]|uniref:SH3 domain-containing protein n=2 Tax=Leptospira kmetyi TaxID=408139 RepID=A0ABX4N4M7_9LEPT|nr:SH3 domain-containing protein [Leptospira kmetyi]